MNNMNPNEMNQMGMGINQMGMNQIGMNLDQTAQNIKEIIQPYENKIRELEEIIKQKDFEITVLKQKLKNSHNDQININQMNMMNLNQMNMMMGVTNQQEKGKEIRVELKFQDNRIINAKCFEKEKASVLREKLNLNASNENIHKITLDYQIIDENLTIEENHIYYGSKLYISSHIINIIFRVQTGNCHYFSLEENCPVGMAIILFLAKKIGKPEMIFDVDRSLFFLYNASRLVIKDNTPIKEIFKGNLKGYTVTIIDLLS